MARAPISTLLRRAPGACAGLTVAALLALSAGSGAAPAAELGGTGRTAAATVTKSSVLAPKGGPFSSRSVWRTDIRKAPVAATTKAYSASIAWQAKTYYGAAAFNVWRYNASFYSVPRNQKRADVRFHDCQGKRYVPAGLYGPGGQFEDVPIPADAVPAAGTDASLTVYQPSTDTMWDFWQAKRDRKGTWSACWGGRMDRVSKSYGYFLNGFGSSASGLANIGGAVGVREAQAGRIDHAMSLALPHVAHHTNVSWPAQRSDGWGRAAGDIPLGTRLRLDPKVNVDKLGLNPMAKMIAKAAQKYGFIATDRSGAVAVVAESGEPVRRATGVNPWEKILGGTPDYMVLRNFPWDKLQALPKDYGKPANAPR